MSCWDDIDATSYVEYRASQEAEWKSSGFCQVCVSYLLTSQWELYTSALAKTTCKAEQRRLLAAGPPMNLKDAKALETPDGAEVHSLWFMSDGQEHSAKLDGSLLGDERTKYWEDQKSFYITDEPDATDADAADKEKEKE